MSGNVLTGYNVAFALTASDTVNAPQPFDAVYVGAAGAVAIVLASGVAVTFSGAVAGSVVPCQGIRVNSTNTAGSGYVGLRRY